MHDAVWLNANLATMTAHGAIVDGALAVRQ